MHKGTLAMACAAAVLMTVCSTTAENDSFAQAEARNVERQRMVTEHLHTPQQRKRDTAQQVMRQRQFEPRSVSTCTATAGHACPGG